MANIPEDQIHALDRALANLTRLGLETSRPDWLARYRARATELRQKRTELDDQRAAADALLPGLLDLYVGGTDADRQRLRDILRECRAFRWGVGWSVARPTPPIDRDAALAALALFSLKDGGGDWRDQQVWLDGLCATMVKSCLDTPPLLREAAAWSNDVGRFAPAPSTRNLLLDYAERFSGGGAPRLRTEE